MTTTASTRHDAIDLASYYARRTVMLAVVALVGLILGSIILTCVLLLSVSDNPFDNPEWVDAVIGLCSVGGLSWFVVFLVMSLNSMRLHSWYHRHMVP